MKIKKYRQFGISEICSIIEDSNYRPGEQGGTLNPKQAEHCNS